ncbi:hypothetical protein K9N50_04215 [bacterium]|nr:hypothetical protein [bacterium]
MLKKINLPSKRREGGEKPPEPDLTPIMSLMVVLIPVLLQVAQLSDIALLEYKPPAEAADDSGGGGGGDDEENTDEEKNLKLDLLVNLHEDGVIQVSMYNKLDLGEHFFEIPAAPNGNYNFRILNDSLYSIKTREVGEPTGIDSVLNEETQKYETFKTYRVEDGRQVKITALGKTPFQSIVDIMDVCRFKLGDESKELFPLTELRQFQ